MFSARLNLPRSLPNLPHPRRCPRRHQKGHTFPRRSSPMQLHYRQRPPARPPGPTCDGESCSTQQACKWKTKAKPLCIVWADTSISAGPFLCSLSIIHIAHVALQSNPLIVPSARHHRVCCGSLRPTDPHTIRIRSVMLLTDDSTPIFFYFGLTGLRRGGRGSTHQRNSCALPCRKPPPSVSELKSQRGQTTRTIAGRQHPLQELEGQRPRPTHV